MTCTATNVPRLPCKTRASAERQQRFNFVNDGWFVFEIEINERIIETFKLARHSFDMRATVIVIEIYFKLANIKFSIIQEIIIGMSGRNYNKMRIPYVAMNITTRSDIKH